MAAIPPIKVMICLTDSLQNNTDESEQNKDNKSPEFV